VIATEVIVKIISSEVLVKVIASSEVFAIETDVQGEGVKLEKKVEN